MIVLGIDPGATKSGVVLWDTKSKIPVDALTGTIENHAVLTMIKRNDLLSVVAIERIRGYGLVSGDDTFDTCEWIGRFNQAAQDRNSALRAIFLIPRKEIKQRLCGNTTTNDKYVREALIDMLEDPEFVGRDAKGTKTIKKGGRLYELSGHTWSALAVAIVGSERVLNGSY